MKDYSLPVRGLTELTREHVDLKDVIAVGPISVDAMVVLLGVRGFFGGRWSVQRSAPSHGDIHHVVSQRRRRAGVR